MNKCYIVRNWSILLVVLLTPILLWLVWHILPTHDDWASTTTPSFEPFFIRRHFLFYGFHWRPFDTWIGYVAGLDPQRLYPAFNHILVVVGHLMCTLCVHRLLTVLQFRPTAVNISTLFFFIAPATMATVTAIDSQNQVYALIFGIFSFLCYIRLQKRKYLVWIILVFIAALWKENGLMWALITPILAYGFDFIDLKTLKRDLLVGIAVIVAYFLAIAILPKEIIIHPDYEPGILKMVKNTIKFFFTTFITVDYVYLLHQPHRNLLLAAISLLVATPFLLVVFFKNPRKWINRKMACTALALLIAVGPHLLTIFSMMHTYAGMAFMAIFIAYGLQNIQQHKTIVITFLLFIAAAVSIDLHLIDESVLSGKIGKKMAQEAISKTGNRVDNVYVIIIEDDYPKLSSFCVVPSDAFGWGFAARHETNYVWPDVIQDTIIERTPEALKTAQRLANEKLSDSSAECVWIVNHTNVDVIKQP